MKNQNTTRIVYEHKKGFSEGTLEIEGDARGVFDAIICIFSSACQAYRFDPVKFAAALPELVCIEQNLVKSIMTDIGAIKHAREGGEKA